MQFKKEPQIFASEMLVGQLVHLLLSWTCGMMTMVTATADLGMLRTCIQTPLYQRPSVSSSAFTSSIKDICSYPTVKYVCYYTSNKIWSCKTEPTA